MSWKYKITEIDKCSYEIIFIDSFLGTVKDTKRIIVDFNVLLNITQLKNRLEELNQKLLSNSTEISELRTWSMHISNRRIFDQFFLHVRFFNDLVHEYNKEFYFNGSRNISNKGYYLKPNKLLEKIVGTNELEKFKQKYEIKYSMDSSSSGHFFDCCSSIDDYHDITKWFVISGSQRRKFDVDSNNNGLYYGCKEWEFEKNYKIKEFKITENTNKLDRIYEDIVNGQINNIEGAITITQREEEYSNHFKKCLHSAFKKMRKIEKKLISENNKMCLAIDDIKDELGTKQKHTIEHYLKINIADFDQDKWDQKGSFITEYLPSKRWYSEFLLNFDTSDIEFCVKKECLNLEFEKLVNSVFSLNQKTKLHSVFIGGPPVHDYDSSFIQPYSLYLKNPKLFCSLETENGKFKLTNEKEFEQNKKYVLVSFLPDEILFVEEQLFNKYSMSNLELSYISIPQKNVQGYKSSQDGKYIACNSNDKKMSTIVFENISKVEDIIQNLDSYILKYLDDKKYLIKNYQSEYENYILKISDKKKKAFRNERTNYVNQNDIALFSRQLFVKNKRRFSYKPTLHKFVISKTKERDNKSFGNLAEKVFNDYLNEYFSYTKWIIPLVGDLNINKVNESQVVWMNKNEESYEPFDFQINLKNRSIYIDVKATRGEDSNIFYLSIAELKHLLQNPSYYFIARISYFEDGKEYNEIKLNSELYLKMYQCTKETIETIKENIGEWEDYYKENSIRFTREHFEEFRLNHNISKEIGTPFEMQICNSELITFEKQLSLKIWDDIFNPIKQIIASYSEFDEFSEYTSPIDIELEYKKIISSFENIKKSYNVIS